MMRRTHAAAGLAIGFALAGQTHQPLLNACAYGLLTQVCALVPDLDIKLHLKHRGVTHSLLALLLISLGAWYTMPLLLPYVALGYGSHLFLDFLTVWGIPILWPVQRRFRLMRLSTGGRIDSLLAVGALCAALYCVVGMIRL